MRSRIVGSVLLTLGLLLLGGALATSVRAGGCHPEGSVASEGVAPTVRISKCEFGPSINRVPVGSSVTFRNEDDAPHNVVGFAGSWGTRADLMRGDTFAHVFTKEGIYAYSCTLHPGMTGAVIVEGADFQAASSTTPVAPPAPAPDGGSPVGMALAGAGGLAIGLVGAGMLFRRREAGG